MRRRKRLKKMGVWVWLLNCRHPKCDLDYCASWFFVFYVKSTLLFETREKLVASTRH